MFHGKTSLRDFNKTVFKYKLTFMKKIYVLHTTTLMHLKVTQNLHNLFSTCQENGSKMTFLTGGTKINFKNLKT